MDHVICLKLLNVNLNTNFTDSKFFIYNQYFRAVKLSPNSKEEFYITSKEWTFQVNFLK